MSEKQAPYRVEMDKLSVTNELAQRLAVEVVHAYNNSYDGVHIDFRNMKITPYRKGEARPLAA